LFIKKNKDGYLFESDRYVIKCVRLYMTAPG